MGGTGAACHANWYHSISSNVSQWRPNVVLQCSPGGGVVTHLSPTVVLHNLYFRCSGHAHSRAAKEEKKAKLIWEGYKRRHKGEIPPKVGGADGGGRCAGTIDTALLCAVWPFPYVNHTLLLQNTRLRCKVCVFAVVGGIRCLP